MPNPLSPLHLTFGESVRRWRQERGFSQDQLSELVGMSTSMIGQIERGEKNTTLETAQKLSDALSVETRDFFIASEEEAPLHRRVLFLVAEIQKQANDRDMEFLTGFCELLLERLRNSDGR